MIRSVIYLLEYDNNIYKNRAGNHAVRAWLLNPEICGLNIFIPLIHKPYQPFNILLLMGHQIQFPDIAVCEDRGNGHILGQLGLLN